MDFPSENLRQFFILKFSVFISHKNGIETAVSADPIGMEQDEQRKCFERFWKTGRIEDYLVYAEKRKEWPSKPSTDS